MLLLINHLASLSYDYYMAICFYFTICLLNVSVGSSFIFGHYYFSLIFKPIIHASFKAVLKKHFYIDVKRSQIINEKIN